MLHICFLASTKVELWDILYSGKWRKISKSHRDLNLGLAVPRIKLVLVIFIYYNVFKFHVPRLISFLSYHA